LSEIGRTLGLTAERARQIEVGALQKLRERLSQAAPVRANA
jgi:DNA-directed RNA polymerase sigma subunit (sigma70/sigma32)